MMTDEQTLQLRDETIEEHFDPLRDDEADQKDSEELAETFGYIGHPEDYAPTSKLGEECPQTADEKIEALLADMIPHKRFLLSLVEFCRLPRSFEDIASKTSEMQARQNTVFSAASYCQMLTQAGALMKIDEEGAPYDKREIEPCVVVRDGTTFVEPSEAPPAFWLISDAGEDALKKDDPLQTLQMIFENNRPFESVFVQILELCEQSGGASINEIKQQVNANPVLEYPNKTAQFFMDYLDRNGAIIWSGAWKTTALGQQALQVLQGSKGEL